MSTGYIVFIHNEYQTEIEIEEGIFEPLACIDPFGEILAVMKHRDNAEIFVQSRIFDRENRSNGMEKFDKHPRREGDSLCWYNQAGEYFEILPLDKHFEKTGN